MKDSKDRQIEAYISFWIKKKGVVLQGPKRKEGNSWKE